MCENNKVIDLNDFKNKKRGKESVKEMPPEITELLINYANSEDKKEFKDNMKDLIDNESNTNVKKFYGFVDDIADMLKSFYK